MLESGGESKVLVIWSVPFRNTWHQSCIKVMNAESLRRLADQDIDIYQLWGKAADLRACGFFMGQRRDSII